jgi:hypothetical protein
MLTRIGTAVLLALACLAVTAQSASGSGCGSGHVGAAVPGAGGICIVAADPGTPETTTHAAATETAGSSGCQRSNGSPVDCVTQWGTWSDTHQCWIHPVDLPKSDPAWAGHAGGSTWMCQLGVVGVLTAFWMPPGADPGLPEPGQLAQHAMGLLPLATAQVRTAPQSPDDTYVGVENWLWVPASQWSRLTKTVTAGATAVTVTAKPTRVLWDLGPDTITCDSPGREWRDGMTDAARTTCGYIYRVTSSGEPRGVFGLSATIQYAVDWVCTGACRSGSGSLGMVDAPAGTGTLEVLQRQTVVVE